MKAILLSLFYLMAYSIYGQMDSLEKIQTLKKLNELVHSLNPRIYAINDEKIQVTCATFDSILQNHEKYFKPYEIRSFYTDMADYLSLSCQKTNIRVYEYFKKAILNGESSGVLLNFDMGIYVKNHYPEKYQELEHLSDSMYIVTCNRWRNVNINLQLGFLLRYMSRKDQDVRTREERERLEKGNKTMDKKYADEINFVDSLNEILLTEIFEQYGYPGWNIVGPEGGTAFGVFTHMSPDFKIKYIHLIEEAMKKGTFLNSISSLNSEIDKTLYFKYGITLYGTNCSPAPPEKDKTVINKYRALLNLTLEE